MGARMKDAADWEFVLNTVDKLFYHLALGIGGRMDMTLADVHEALWSSFEQGQFKLKPGDDDDDDVEVVPCECLYDRRVAIEQNKALANYRQLVTPPKGAA
jgi:thiamine pyrophosphokinase